MMKKRIEVGLTEKELGFIKWMAKRDDVSLAHEFQMIFNTELYQLMENYGAEYEAEKESKK